MSLPGYGEILQFEAKAQTHELPAEYDTVRVRIFKLGYTGVVTEIEGAGQDPLTIEYGRQAEFDYTPLIPSRAELNVHVTNSVQAGIVEGIFGSDPQDYLMEFSFSLAVSPETFTEFWSGWVNTGFFQEQFKPRPYETRLRASCGLNTLKQIRWEASDVLGLLDSFDFIRRLLDPINRLLGYSISDRIFAEVFTDDSPTLGPLEQTVFDPRVYNGQTHYDVLEFILRSKLLTLTHSLNQWQIWNRDDLREGTNFSRRIYTTAGTPVTQTVGGIDRSSTCAAPDLKWADRVPRRLLSTPADRVRARYEFDDVELLEDNVWLQGVDWTGPNANPFLLGGWNFVSQGYNDNLIVQPTGELVMTGAVNGSAARMTAAYFDQEGTPPNLDTLSYIDKTGYPILNPDDDLRLKFRLRIRAQLTQDAIAPPDGIPPQPGPGIVPEPVPMFCRIKIGAWQLDQAGGWVNNPPQDLYFQINGEFAISSWGFFETYEFKTDFVPTSDSLDFRITTGIDTAGSASERAVDFVDIDLIQIIFIDGEGNERSLSALEYETRKDVAVVRNEIDLGTFRHGDGPISGYPGSLRTPNDEYTRFWGFAGEAQETDLYDFIVTQALLQKGRPRNILQGTLLGRFSMSNALNDAGIRYYPNYLRIRPVTNRADIYAEQVTRFTFGVINPTPVPVIPPPRGPIQDTSPNLAQALQKTASGFTQDGRIRKTVLVEDSGDDGTLSKRISGLTAKGQYALNQMYEKSPIIEEPIRVELQDGRLLIHNIVTDEKIEIGFREPDQLVPVFYADDVAPGSSGANGMVLSREFIGFSTLAGKLAEFGPDQARWDGSTIQPFIDLDNVVAPINSLTIPAGTNFTIDLTAVGQSGEVRGMSGGVNGRTVKLINRGTVRADIIKDSGDAPTGQKFYYCKNQLRLTQGQVATFVYMDAIPGNGGEGGWKLTSVCTE